ncbi:MAG: hypothetical protein QM756_36695 [Polyangiaceae bacterium]
MKLRSSILLGLALFGLSYARAARAETSPAQQCIDDHANGQVIRGQGGLLQARGLFLSCAAKTCPQVIRDDCTRFATEVEATLPSVIVVAQNAAGQDSSAAQVRVDESTEAVPVDGRAIFVNPGSHVFKVSGPNQAQGSVTLVIHEAEKYRRVVVRLEGGAAAPAPAAKAGPGVSPLVYVFGGLGLLAAGSFTYFAFDGRQRESDLDKCAPSCARDDVDAMRRSYLIGDVSLGVAVASLGAGAYFLLRSPSSAQSSTSSALSLSATPDLQSFRLLARTEF